MATGKDGAVGRQLRTLFNVGAIRELTDGQLLERFATGRGEGAELAFAALVERHGPMVLRVARGVLDDPHDAQDAFQATFLVLVAKARGLWVRDSIAPWLHQVAYRTASCARSVAARRRRLERRAATDAREASRPPAVDDLPRVLLEEVDRLPERYRAPVVLCDLEGKTHEQAARSLGWPVGTVKSRQARARRRLRDRLTRRGVAPGLGLPVAWPAAEVSVPATLVNSTTLAAVQSALSRAIVPGTAAALAKEVIRAMTILRWTKAASTLLALGLAASGAGLVAQERGDKPVDAPKPAAKAQEGPADDGSVVEVKPGRFHVTLHERGYLEASRSQDVMCEVEGGTVLIAVLPEGSKVKAGEVVAELDSARLKDNLVNQVITTRQAEAAYRQSKLVREVAEYALMEYTQGVYPGDREALQGKIINARSGIEKAQARLERTRLARKRLDEASSRRAGPETPSDVVADLTVADRLDEAELDIQARKIDLEVAQTQQNVLQKYTADKTTKQLNSQVERAKADELSKEASWELEKTKERKLNRQIEKCTLKAPGDGMIVLANDSGRTRAQPYQIEEGATVRERQKILSVVNLADPLRVNAKVHESLIGRVAPGQVARIKVDAFADRVFSGVVRSVAPLADANRVLADGKKVYTALVEVERGERSLRPGLSASVEIAYQVLDDLLLVPIPAVIFSSDGKQTFVAVKGPGGGFEWRQVTLGRSNGKVVEVKEGLKPGDRVARELKAELGLDMNLKAPGVIDSMGTPSAF